MLLLRRKLLQIFIARTMPYYAVASGRKLGIYETWSQCEQQVKGFKGALYKKFATRQEAEEFIGTNATCYFPKEESVPLGGICKHHPPSWKNKQEECKNKNTEFWPDDVSDDEGNCLNEEDLISAINEVEGFPTQTASRKRKADNVNGSTSKIPKHKSNVLEAVGLKKIGSFEFLLDAEGYVIVYTDGSCIRNGQPGASAGFGVYFGDNHKLNAAKPVLGRVTNNVGEIQAAIYAIKTALDLCIPKLCINTDSQFLINSITLWVNNWKRRNWRLKNNEPVKNVADFKELDELLRNNNIRVKWNYVEAHKGIKGNEMADALARRGSELYKELNK